MHKPRTHTYTAYKLSPSSGRSASNSASPRSTSGAGLPTTSSKMAWTSRGERNSRHGFMSLPAQRAGSRSAARARELVRDGRHAALVDFDDHLEDAAADWLRNDACADKAG